MHEGSLNLFAVSADFRVEVQKREDEISQCKVYEQIQGVSLTTISNSFIQPILPRLQTCEFRVLSAKGRQGCSKLRTYKDRKS